MEKTRAICVICVRTVLFMSVQCYLCAYSAICIHPVFFVCVQYYLYAYSAFLCVRCYLYANYEPINLKIFNKKTFMPQIGNFLARMYVFFKILI